MLAATAPPLSLVIIITGSEQTGKGVNVENILTFRFPRQDPVKPVQFMHFFSLCLP